MITLASGKSIDVSPTLLIQIVRSALKVQIDGKAVSIIQKGKEIQETLYEI